MTGRLHALADRLILAGGFPRLTLAFGLGALGALAMPPFGVLPALALALAPAVWLIDGAARGRGGWRGALASAGSAAGIGWAWGFGYHVAGLWWLGSAFLVEADQFAWALPLGVLGLPAYLALYAGFGFGLARLLWSPGLARVFALAGALTLSEWLRGHWLTGFPWNATGMALAQNLLTMQAASVVGLYGLSFLAVLAAAAPATLATGATTRARAAGPVLCLLVLASLAGFGAWRLPAGASPTLVGVRLRIVQPNLPQDQKFSAKNRDAIMARYIGLSDRPPGAADAPAPTHLIWPESAFPFLIQRDARALGQIAQMLSGGRVLMTGAARADEEGLPGERLRFYNAVFALGGDGLIADVYDKVHLVPFGEYLPTVLDGLLRTLSLRQFVSVPGGFTPGEAGAQRLLTVPGLPPLAVAICYEAIFPDAVVPRRAGGGQRPGAILNVTNDAWFGDTPGPRQHFAQSRLRAVEEGLPLIRAANTGLSGIVDPYGRITGMTRLDAETVLDGGMPAALPAPTPFAMRGGTILVGLLLLALGVALAGRRRRA